MNGTSGQVLSRAVPGLRIEVHGTLQGLERVWKALALRSECYVFQTWEWSVEWQAHVGDSQRVLPRIIQVMDSEGLTLGIWPMAIYRSRGLSVLGFMGDVVSDYRAPLLAPEWYGSVEAASFPALWRECLDAVEGADVVWLERMPERFGRLMNPMASLPGAVQAENAYAACLPDSVPSYLAGRSKNLLAQNRRHVRRLQEHGEYVFTPQHGASDAQEIFAALVGQKSRRWRETGSRDLFADKAYLDFYRTLMQHELPGGMVSLCSLKVGETVVAAQWGLVFRNRYYWILPSYEVGQWAKYSCGRLLLQAMIEWAIQENMAVFDLTVGDESYKKDWANECLPLWRWRAANSLRGRVFLAGVNFKEAVRAHPVLSRWARRARELVAGGRRK